MNTPLVSVLTTVYNRERFLAAAIDSVLGQSFRDFELIIVDDCSTDKSVGIARRYEHDGRVRVSVNDRNLGDYPNRNRAASLARGKYLKFVDADDLIYPHSLAIMVEAMEAHPAAGVGLSHSAPEAEQPYPWELSPLEAYRKQFLGRGCLGCGPSGTLIRRDLFEQIGGFSNWGVLSDIDLWLRLAARCPVLLLQPGLVWWRRHDGQEFTRNGAAQVYLKRGFELEMKTLQDSQCPLSPEERRRAGSRARQHHARRLWALGLRRGRLRDAWALYRSSGLSSGELLLGLRKYRS